MYLTTYGDAKPEAGWQVSMDMVRVMTEEASGLLAAGSMMHVEEGVPTRVGNGPSRMCVRLRVSVCLSVCPCLCARTPRAHVCVHVSRLCGCARARGRSHRVRADLRVGGQACMWTCVMNFAPQQRDERARK